MKLIPILFSTPMVQAILSDNKSMTRRTTGLDEINKDLSVFEYKGTLKDDPTIHVFARMFHDTWVETKHIKCPYGQPCDVLWVRESFNITDPNDSIEGEFIGEETGVVGSVNGKEVLWRFVYKASSPENHPTKGKCKWKPNIHMPFEACRIFLRVKEIRVERLQDITAADITREGVVSSFTNPKMGVRHENAISMEFERLWISINGKDSWLANPWVWVVSFERITNISEIVDIVELWNERRAK